MKVGTKLRSVTGTTEVVVTRAPAGDTVLACAGDPLAEGDAGTAASSGEDSDVLLGKRYVDEESGIGFGRVDSPGTEPSPLLRDFPWVGLASPAPPPSFGVLLIVLRSGAMS